MELEPHTPWWGSVPSPKKGDSVKTTFKSLLIAAIIAFTIPGIVMAVTTPPTYHLEDDPEITVLEYKDYWLITINKGEGQRRARDALEGIGAFTVHNIESPEM